MAVQSLQQLNSLNLVTSGDFRSESAVQPIRGARSYRKDVRPGAGHATVAQEEGGDKNS